MGCEFGLNTYNLCSHHVTVNAISLFQWPPNVGFAVVNSPHSSFIRETPSKGVIPLSAASSAVLNNPQEDSLRPCAHNPGAALCIPTTCSQLVQRASDGMKISPQYSGLSIPARHVLLVSEVEWERILVNDPRKIPSASLIAKHVDSNSHNVFITDNSSGTTVQQSVSSFPSCSNYVTSLSSCSCHFSASTRDHPSDSSISDVQQSDATFASTCTQRLCDSCCNQTTGTANITRRFSCPSCTSEFSNLENATSASSELGKGKVIRSLSASAWLDSLIAESRADIDRERLIKHAHSDSALSSEKLARKRPIENDKSGSVACQTLRKKPRTVSLSSRLGKGSSSSVESGQHFLLVSIDDAANLGDKNGGVLVRIVGSERDGLGRPHHSDDANSVERCEELSIGNSSSTSPSPLSEGSSSALACSPYQESEITRRATGMSLAGMSQAEVTDRKRRQNRAAAARYRRKMKEKKRKERLEVESLEKNIKKLKVEAELLEDQISKLRKIIFESVIDRNKCSVLDKTGA
ncbi:hypothetical protein Tcan_15645 [Toxocara canis]|uniref:BZIP domain-containing protein n=1 Tax=Toxocara canis TaxID=6265 RepID=A0A0B2VHL6_TOXCA|nr:hypothetical protein Tcan_15645 [Toxocara canis]